VEVPVPQTAQNAARCLLEIARGARDSHISTPHHQEQSTQGDGDEIRITISD
jgi:hypothetical protein